MAGVEIFITQRSPDDPVVADIWCPAFVDKNAECESIESATKWVNSRIDRAGDPFEEYEDD